MDLTIYHLAFLRSPKKVLPILLRRLLHINQRYCLLQNHHLHLLPDQNFRHPLNRHLSHLLDHRQDHSLRLRPLHPHLPPRYHLNHLQHPIPHLKHQLHQHPRPQRPAHLPTPPLHQQYPHLLYLLSLRHLLMILCFHRQ